MHNTFIHEDGEISIRMDRTVIVDRLPLGDVHDRPLCANLGSHSGEFKSLCVNNLGNQRVHARLTL